MLSSFCSPLNSIPNISGIISVVTAGIISVVRIISMVGIISVAVQLLQAVFNDMFCRSTVIACFRLAGVFKEDFKTLGYYFLGKIPVE